MLWRQQFFLDSQGALKERLGGAVIPARQMEGSQIVQARPDFRMIRTQSLFVQSEGLTIECLCLFEFPLQFQLVSQSVQLPDLCQGSGCGCHADLRLVLTRSS